MLTVSVSEYELPRELLTTARDRAVKMYDKIGGDFDAVLRAEIYHLVIRSCWEEFRHRRKEAE